MKLFNNKSPSIFYRLLFSSLAYVFAIVITFTVLFYYFDKSSVQKHYKDVIHQQMESIAYSFYQMKTNLILNNQTIASNPIVDNFLTSSKLNYEINARALEKLFEEYISYATCFQSIYIVDYLGREKIRVDKSIGRIKKYRDFSGRELFKEIESDTPGKTGADIPYINKSGETVFSTGVNVIDGDIGEFGGGIFIDHNYKEFIESLNRIKVSEESIVWVFSANGQILNQPLFIKAAFNPEPFMSKGFNETMQFAMLDEGMLAYQDLSFIPSQPFIRIAITVSSSFLLEDILKVLRFYLIVFLIFTAIIVLSVYYQSKYFTKPIIELSKAALILAKGDLATTVNVEADGEIKTLIDSFNQMSKDLNLSRLQIIERSNELTAMNEELDTTNEELIATNEELDSTNEELNEINEILEQRVKERTRELDEAQEIAHLGSWSWDIASGQIWWSDEMYRIYGVERGEFALTLENVLSVTHPLDLDRIKKHLTDSFNKKLTHPKPYEYRIILKDGEENILFAKSIITFDKTKEPIIMSGIIQDITERKRAEAEKEELWHQLVQSQKMESIGRLTGRIAHDFNNFLTSIIGFSSLAYTKLPDGSEVRDLVARVNNAGQRASKLINQLLAFSRKQYLEMKVTNLNNIIDSISDILKGLISEKTTLELKIKSPVNNVKADETQIEQILMNLIVNANQAMPEGGRIIVETSDVELDTESAKAYQGASSGSYVKMIVTDAGIGMTPEIMEKIFEPFFTTKERGEGTGFGLSTVFGIVNQHSGFLSVKSEPGAGTAFEIYLPAAKDKVEEKSAGKERVELSGTETVLIIDDDVSNLELYYSLITPRGYNVLRANSVDEAVQIANNYEGTINLLLTDVVMPTMDGWEVFETIRGKRAKIKVIFVSGFIDNPIVMNNILKNKMPFIKKPFDPNYLISKLRDVLDEKA